MKKNIKQESNKNKQRYNFENSKDNVSGQISVERKESFKERILNLLSDIFSDFIIPTCFCILCYCIPLIMQLLGFASIAFISFKVLIILTGSCCIFNLFLFIFAICNQNANQISRCIYTVIPLIGAAIAGTIVAKLVGVF